VFVLIMVLVAVTLLPAFLGLAGHRVNRFGIRRAVRPRVRAARAGRVGAGTSPATPGSTPSGPRPSSSHSPRPSSGSASASRTRAPCRRAVRSVGPTTSSRRASDPAATARWSSRSTSPRTPMYWAARRRRARRPRRRLGGARAGRLLVRCRDDAGLPDHGSQDEATVDTIDACGRRSSRGHWPTAPPGPTSAVRRPPGRISARGWASGCRCSSRRWSCSRSSC
jgi:hypothetical protein